MTFTVLEWLPVFMRPDTVQILLEAFTYRQQNRGVRWYGYVIPENHLHCILQSPDSTFPKAVIPAGRAGIQVPGKVSRVGRVSRRDAAK